MIIDHEEATKIAEEMIERWGVFKYNLKRRGASNREIAREVLCAEVISKLNDQNRFCGGMFDGGELGVLRIYWMKSTWEHRWYDLEPLPEGVSAGDVKEAIC